MEFFKRGKSQHFITYRKQISFTLENVVPWGRSFEEYVSMFSLTDADLKKNILGCGDGPASFNSELTKQGGRVTSVDPIYQFCKEEIEKRVDATFSVVMEQTRTNKDEFVWKNISTVEELGQIRMAAMKKFLNDYPNSSERYIQAELPDLTFEKKRFDLSLSSHFLFLYSEQLSYDFHFQSIKELCRVAKEARIFPILELGAKRSRHIDKAVNELKESGYQCCIEKVEYEFQKGGNEMLRVKSFNK
jgi:hypothetical protein